MNNWTSATIVYLISFFIYVSTHSKYKLDAETYKKLKKIATWEKRPKEYQVKYIIEMYIDAYTEKHKIDWDRELY